VCPIPDLAECRPTRPGGDSGQRRYEREGGVVGGGRRPVPENLIGSHAEHSTPRHGRSGAGFSALRQGPARMPPRHSDHVGGGEAGSLERRSQLGDPLVFLSG